MKEKAMKRRDFLKTGMGLAASAMLPGLSYASSGSGLRLPLERVQFGENNDAQTIIIYLMGGQGEIIGNMSNFDELIELDPKYNDFLGRFHTTKDDFWVEAGGEYIQEMVDNGDATIFRTCQENDTLRSHYLNQVRFMRGNNVGYDSGMVSTMFHVLDRFAPAINKALMPNVTYLDSNYQLLTDGATDNALPSALKPVSFSPLSKSNPFEWKASVLDQYVDAELLSRLAREVNAQRSDLNPSIGELFEKRQELERFVSDVFDTPLPEGIDYRANVKGTVRYDDYHYGQLLEIAMRILVSNPDTKVVSMQGGPSWDDHSNALTAHSDRAKYLYHAVKAAIDHAKAVGKENISIILFGDFGRNMKINNALGWDHGRNQNFQWFGGRKYVNHQGIVGKTELSESYGRIYTHPAKDSYTFEPYSIAATFYKLNGVKNPEVLTGGFKEIDPSKYTGEKFLKV